MDDIDIEVIKEHLRRIVKIRKTICRKVLEKKMGNRLRGLYKKFNVSRTDGSSKLGGKHYGCRYLVLDIDHDIHAKSALLVYAQAVLSDGYRLLAQELSAWVGGGICNRCGLVKPYVYRTDHTRSEGNDGISAFMVCDECRLKEDDGTH